MGEYLAVEVDVRNVLEQEYVHTHRQVPLFALDFYKH